MRMSRCLVICLAVALASLLGSAAQANLVVNDFGDGVQSWRFDFGGSGYTISQDPTEGSLGNAAGALRLDMNFAANSFAFTGDVFGSETDLSGYDNLEFDLKIAPGAALDAFGNNGYLSFDSRETNSYTSNSLLGENLTPAVGWQSYSLPTASLTATRAFTLQLFGGGGQNINGNITLFLDNVRLTTTAIPEPSAFLMFGLASLVCGRSVLCRRR